MFHPKDSSPRDLIRRSRRLGSALFTALVCLALSGCSSWLDGPQSTLAVDGPVARAQLNLFYTTCYVILVIFVLVGGTLAYAMLRFRARSKADEHAEPPPQSHGNPIIELSLVVASLGALVFIAVPTIKDIWFDYDVPKAERAEALQIVATGHQWWWQFQYPQVEVKLPYGGQAPLATANELVIPVGKPVHIELRTADVIHSFWVPKLAGKVDMIPNRANHMWLQADKAGYYYGQCAQYCGLSHAVMRFRVIALPEAEYKAWLANQVKPAHTVTGPEPAHVEQTVFKHYKQNQFGFSDKWMATSPTSTLNLWRAKQLPNPNEDPALIAKGRKLFQAKTCFACHTIRGHEGIGVTGPDLTHVGARSTIAGGLLENTPSEMARWISHPNLVKPGNIMYESGYIPNHITFQSGDVAALVAYLQSLK
ncbi:cytochrome c oxidase subunit 2 precursor [mine drainage metagenome]|uniref:cytochrome-c oxidase n=1 Tax=mine drainage metagenome TaxID=410659 RepID=A0A1J5S7E5_9ZZZZ